ncbi:MAG: PQQ-binding-like beta-propeller repeat protein [Planctomycetota bacterium]
MPLALVVSLLPLALGPAEWGSFRGPNGAGRGAPGSVPAALALEDGVAWRVEVPSGYSSPVVAGARVFVTGADGDELLTLCLDADSGAILWRRAIPSGGEAPGQGHVAAPTPATDGARVVALFHGAGPVAYDLDGEELWRADPGVALRIPHGIATSPVIARGRVLLQLDHDAGSRLACFDATTGEEVWSAPRPRAMHGYATPAVWTPDGPDARAEVVVVGSYEVHGYSLDDGELLWRVTGGAWQTKGVPVIDGARCVVNASAQVYADTGLPRLPPTWDAFLALRDADGDGLVSREEWPDEGVQRIWTVFDLEGDDRLDAQDFAYVKTIETERGAVLSIRLGGRGDVTGTHVDWRYGDRRGLSDVVSPVLAGGRVLLLRAGGIVTALDGASGTSVAQGRLGRADPYFASPVTDGERVLATSVHGRLCAVSASAPVDELWSVDLDERTWGTPALARGRVFVRTMDALWCLRPTGGGVGGDAASDD